ncbi:MAG TPA: PAS domain-containing protein [Cyclobacteriaceae bacterium]|jgi:signal transduction histidine kinase|nr:PAS domain-containing protein [Cyclobacteriaceae bacterium]
MEKAECTRCSCGEINEFQEEAERSRKIINAMFDSTQSFIILISLDYLVMFFNKRALHSTKLLYGIDLKVGDSVMSYMRLGDEIVFQNFKDNFNEVVETGNIIISENEMQFHNMSCWFRNEYTPVYDQGEIIGVALRIVDVTERKKKEQQIEKQNEQLRKIAWIQSHQTRQPIATMLGLIYILDKVTLTEDNLKIIRMLEAEVGKLDAVISDTVTRANSVE